MDLHNLVLANASTGLPVLPIADIDHEPFNLTFYLEQQLGPQRLTLNVVIPVTCIYPVLFLLGVGGNLLTVIVIYKNNYMHTITNYYLASLAVSDLLMLILGLPLELYAFWHQYPYNFPHFVCPGRALISEMTTNASILTITAFTIERYIAICHPFLAQTISTLSRTTKIITLIWIMALAGAAPYAHFLRINYLPYPNTNISIAESAHCNVPIGQINEMFYLLTISSSLFFLLPLGVLTVLYAHIAYALKRSAHRFDLEQMRTGSSTSETSRAQSTQSRKSIVRMLFNCLPPKDVKVFVCLAFFVCWAPFHTQRLLWASYNHYFHDEEMKEIFTEINGYLYAWAGCCYYSNSVINVIIYNALSNRFRHAFRDTIYRSTCLHRRELDYTNCHYHSTAPSGVPFYAPYRRQSTVPSLPQSRRGSHIPQMELSEFRLHNFSACNGRSSEVRQDSLVSTDSGLGIVPLPAEQHLITPRDISSNHVRRMVRLRQVSESIAATAVEVDVEPDYHARSGDQRSGLPGYAL